MKSITIHNLDESLELHIREKAKKYGISLNKTIQMLLKQSLGLDSKIAESHREDFLKFSGVWSESDQNEFNRNTESFSKIDDQEWQ